MQTHIDKIYSFLNENLPYTYVEDVLKIYEKKGVVPPAASTIRKVRIRYSDSHANRLDILDTLVDVAKNKQKANQKLFKKIN